MILTCSVRGLVQPRLIATFGGQRVILIDVQEQYIFFYNMFLLNDILLQLMIYKYSIVGYVLDF